MGRHITHLVVFRPLSHVIPLLAAGRCHVGPHSWRSHQRQPKHAEAITAINHLAVMGTDLEESGRAELWSSGHGSPLPLPGCSREAGTEEGRPARWLAPPRLATPAGS